MKDQTLKRKIQRRRDIFRFFIEETHRLRTDDYFKNLRETLSNINFSWEESIVSYVGPGWEQYGLACEIVECSGRVLAIEYGGPSKEAQANVVSIEEAKPANVESNDEVVQIVRRIFRCGKGELINKIISRWEQ